jgi:threonine dehydrogenase-like Zn-dependent dehydrogenase
MDDHQRVIAELSALTGGQLCPRVVEATGAPWPLDLAGELTGVGGRLVIAGYHQGGLRSVNVQLWNWRGIDVVNAHERDTEVVLAGIREAVAAVVSGRLDPRPLYTHSFPLEKLGAALDAAALRPDGFVKALVTR